MLTAVGAVPKIVCQTTVWPWLGNPAGSGTANCAPACAPPGNASFEKLKPTSPGNKASGGVALLYVGMAHLNLCARGASALGGWRRPYKSLSPQGPVALPFRAVWTSGAKAPPLLLRVRH